jgi:hypothetical protein
MTFRWPRNFVNLRTAPLGLAMVQTIQAPKAVVIEARSEFRIIGELVVRRGCGNQ